jgi:hypothetical protein
MKKIWRASTVLAISFFLILPFFVPSSYAGPQIYSYSATPPPVIDGNPSDWAGSTPSFELNTPTTPDPADPIYGIPNYPISTYVYFKNDATYLYVLVDAVGDQTNGIGCDEVLLEFNLSPTTDFEVGYRAGVTDTDPDPLPAGSQVSVGFGTSFNNPVAHRIYELRIPLSYFGASAGDNVYFSSPRVKAICGAGPEIVASIPFDGGDGNSGILDNVYPYNLNQSDPDTYAQLQLNGQSIPTLTEWGMIIFMVLAGLGALYYMRRQRRRTS